MEFDAKPLKALLEVLRSEFLKNFLEIILFSNNIEPGAPECYFF